MQTNFLKLFLGIFLVTGCEFLGNPPIKGPANPVPFPTDFRPHAVEITPLALKVISGFRTHGFLKANSSHDLPIAFAITQAPAHGSIEGFNEKTGEFTFVTKDSKFFGADSFKFQAGDGEAVVEAVATVSIEAYNFTGYWEVVRATDVSNFGSVDCRSSGLEIGHNLQELYLSDREFQCDGGITVSSKRIIGQISGYLSLDGVRSLTTPGATNGSGVLGGAFIEFSDSFWIDNVYATVRFELQPSAAEGEFILKDSASGGIYFSNTVATIRRKETPKVKPAYLEFIEAPSDNQRIEVVTKSGSKLVTVKNTGETEASDISWSSEGVGIRGKWYPGKGGTCGNSLNPGETCTINLQWGFWSMYSPANFHLHYQNGTWPATSTFQFVYRGSVF